MRAICVALTMLCAATVSSLARDAVDEPNSIYTESGYHVEREWDAPRSARVHRQRGEVRHARKNSEQYAEVSRSGLIARMRHDLGRNPTGWGHNWCAHYLGMLTGRPNLNWAPDWADEGTRAPAGAVGSVAVMSYHVGVVTGSCPGGVMVISGNHNHVVGEGCYPRSHIIAYRWVAAPDKQIVKSEIETIDVKEFLEADIKYLAKPKMVRTGPLVASVMPEVMQPGDREKIVERDEYVTYLCDVYKREPEKEDNAGVFTWKDIAAAKRMKKELCDYVIGGMSRTAQKAFYKAGKKLDAMGVRWSILSAFRDDWRQKIAAGIKACTSCSLHGGSASVGGYGNGVAVDVTIVGDKENGPQRAGDLFARIGREFGLTRPYPGFDPAHIQLVNYVSHRRQAHRHHGTRYASS